MVGIYFLFCVLQICYVPTKTFNRTGLSTVYDFQHLLEHVQIQNSCSKVEEKFYLLGYSFHLLTNIITIINRISCQESFCWSSKFLGARYHRCYFLCTCCYSTNNARKFIFFSFNPHNPTG